MLVLSENEWIHTCLTRTFIWYFLIHPNDVSFSRHLYISCHFCVTFNQNLLGKEIGWTQIKLIIRAQHPVNSPRFLFETKFGDWFRRFLIISLKVTSINSLITIPTDSLYKLNINLILESSR